MQVRSMLLRKKRMKGRAMTDAITLIVPYPGGGGTDQRARLLAQHLSRELGIAVNAVNRPGAVVGHTAIAEAAPDGTTIASAGFDNHVKLWNANDGKYLHTLRGHVGAVYMVAFSPDSRLLVSGSKDTTLKAWEVRTGKLAENLPGHKDQVFAVDWSPDGERVGSGGQDKAVRIWRH